MKLTAAQIRKLPGYDPTALWQDIVTYDDNFNKVIIRVYETFNSLVYSVLNAKN